MLRGQRRAQVTASGAADRATRTGVRRPLSGIDPHDRRAPSSDHDRGVAAPAGRPEQRQGAEPRWQMDPRARPPTSESLVEADRDRGGRYGTRPGRAPRSAAWRDLLVGVAAVKPLVGSFVHAANTLAGMPFAERDEREVQPMLVASRREHEPEGSLRSRSRRDRHVDLQQAGEPRAVGSIVSATLNIGQSDAPILQAAPLALRRHAELLSKWAIHFAPPLAWVCRRIACGQRAWADERLVGRGLRCEGALEQAVEQQAAVA